MKKVEPKEFTIAALRKRHGELKAELATAESATGAARKSAIEAKIDARNGFDFATDVHRKEIDADVVRNALHLVETRIAEREREDLDEADRAKRADVAARIEAIAAAYEAAGEPFAIAVAEAEAIAKTGEVFFPGIGLFEFLAKAKVEIPNAFTELAGELRHKARAVIAGKAPPHFPKPFVPELQLVKPAPVHIFPLCNFTYESRGEHGKCAAHTNAYVPADVAARAIQKNFAVAGGDARVPEMSKSMVAGWVARWGSRYLNLDTDSIDMDPAKLMTISAPKTAAPAAFGARPAAPPPPGLPPLPPGIEPMPNKGQVWSVPIAGPKE